MKITRKFAGAVLLATAIATPSYLALHYRARARVADFDGDLSNEIVRRDAGLAIIGPLDPKRAALAVRDYIYRTYRLEPERLPNASPAMRYASLSSPDGTMFCGGAGVAYVWALQAIGIPARFIQLAGDDFLDGIDGFDTHVTVEAFLDGAWQISDPTYNVSVACSTDPAKPIATPEARACIKDGHSLVLTPGKTQIAEKTKWGSKIADPKVYQRYFSAYTRGKVSSPIRSERVDTFPQDWYETAVKLAADCGVQLGLNMQCQ